MCVCIYKYIHICIHVQLRSELDASLIRVDSGLEAQCVCMYIHIYTHIHTCAAAK